MRCQRLDQRPVLQAAVPHRPVGIGNGETGRVALDHHDLRTRRQMTDAKSPVLLFEGTYTTSFADRPQPTPRYDYNQMLYRLDLDDPRLAKARGDE